MSGGEEILSLWVGPESQKLAHHFYSLQAEQFYDEQADPTNQNALWTFKDKQMQQKYPRMLIFDTASDHLTRLRKVNHSKMIKKMQQPTQNEMYFNFQFMPQEAEEVNDPDAHLFENWNCSEDNYALIDKKCYVDKMDYDDWENLYKISQDSYQDKIRKHLEKTDYLRVLSVCSDAQPLAFAHKLIHYLKDECPKKSIIMCNVADPKADDYFRQSFLPLLGSVASDVDILVDFDQEHEKYEYFQNNNYFAKISPVINSLMTPFILKDSNCAQFMQRIDAGNRPLFNMAYTLPIINEQSQLNPETNIFEYLPTPPTQIKKHTQGEEADKLEKLQNRINCTNGSYLNITNPPKPEKKYNELKGQERIDCISSRLIAESFVIKGQFENIEKLWTPRINKFSLKYLQGILSTNASQQLKYSEFYRKDYGQQVLQYPFHSVIYQHIAFGPSIRNFIRRHHTSGLEHELVSEWKENVYALSDLYGEQNASDSD